MSYGSILDTAGLIQQQYLPPAPITNGSIATIFSELPTIAAPVTTLTSLPFNCPESGNYFIQLYMRIANDGNVGTSPHNYFYTTSQGFGDNSVSPASLAAGPAGGLPFVFTTIGFIGAGPNIFTFAPGAALDLGSGGELALRVIGRVVI